MMVLDPQYKPSPAGTARTNHANMAGSIHCIIWFICFCWSVWVAVFRPVEIRCWSHMEAKTTTVRKIPPLFCRSIHRNLVLRGVAPWMMSTS